MEELKAKARQSPELGEALAKLEAEKRARREVYETIISMIEPIGEEVLLQKLPFLDCNSWKEVIEERFLGKVCGFPTCSKTITPRKFQKYWIDSKARKVYEVSTEREKFCGARCFDMSIMIMAQLDEQPLWITGQRTKKSFVIEEPKNPSRELKPLPLPKKQQRPSYEFVPDQIVAPLKNLKVAEAAESQADSDSDAHEFLDSDEGDFETKADDRFIASIRNFLTSKQQKPSKKSPLQAPDEEKLARLRNKYGTKKEAQNKKKPIIIDAPIMQSEASCSNVVTVNNAKQVKDDTIPLVWKITKEWIGAQTKELVNLGGPRLVNKGDIAQLRAFFAGESAYQELDVNLPPIDSLNVHRRRCEILINQLKKPWTYMEEKLELQRSHYDTLLALVRSFALTADLPVLSVKQTHALVIILFRIACMLDQQDIEKRFFPTNLPPSNEIKAYASEKKLNFDDYCDILDSIGKSLV
ncbi:unnamed protein product, partial [Mesorhabditis belari]|uniref:RNA polymerase II subunit B1 CTD phosphatase RPAP2 homolog n=1 Tax=Mesorhabditis belari TaxID=2138241 RepID=A0AAF3EL30_9BILA